MTFVLFAGYVLAVILGIWAFRVCIDRLELDRYRWSGPAPHTVPITFLNAGMAIRPSVLGHQVPLGYRYACLFFGVGLIDRTGTVDHGFEPEILDPIPSDFSITSTMAELCSQRAISLVEESQLTNKPIRLLWSGGIDSTCAAVALLDALGDDTKRLEVAYSDKSLAEYPQFRKMLKKRSISMVKIKSIADALDPDALIVTGEHGDQIFGSMLAATFTSHDLRRSWQVVIPKHIGTEIGANKVGTMLEWIEPQLSKCPIPIESTYDFLWWANFSMKWQTVSQRVLAGLDTTDQRNAVSPLLRHFFRTDDFQRWALANPRQKIGDSWLSYKYPLKDIIFAFNGDEQYRKNKVKERSLRGLTGRLAKRAVAIDLSGQMYAEPLDRSV